MTNHNSPLARGVYRYDFVTSIELRARCIACSYCGHLMSFGAFQIKRPVPVGAKDLNLYDEVYCWHCGNCGTKSNKNMVKCEQGCPNFHLNICEPFYSGNGYPFTEELGLLGYFEFGGYGDENRIYEDSKYIGCNLHLKCAWCNKAIEDYKLKCGTYTRQIEKHRTYHGTDYFHLECYGKLKEKEVAELHARRIDLGLCTICGLEIGLLNKLSGKRKHTNC